MTAFSALKVTPDARALVDQALARATTQADRERVKAALVAAAAADLNRVLTVSEAQIVTDAFTAAGPGQLPPDALKLAIDSANATLKAMTDSADLDGISNLFTLQGASVEKRMVQELKDAVGRANGRPINVNMLIFEFQSDAMEKAITDLATDNPNVTFRIIADSGQASETGGNALPELMKRGLPNVQVKYKKDFPYVWSAARKEPIYNHGSTQGLNHHKGFTTTIDGVPDALLTGSFNWSSTADTKNYEDLTVFRNRDAATRRPITQFTAEFAGYWNNPNAALSPNDFKNFKAAQWDAMMVAHGEAPIGATPLPSDGYPEYTVPTSVKAFDINGYSAEDEARLAKVLGSKDLARKVISERTKFGRFSSIDELTLRMPGVAPRLTPDEYPLINFGSGQLSINAATVEELDRVGFSRGQAEVIVAYRNEHGDYDSIDDLAIKVGIPAPTIKRLGPNLTAVDIEVFFNSRASGDPSGGTGYGPDGSRLAMVANANGVVEPTRASVVVAATDLFNRAQAGQKICVAMYGANPSAPEFKAMVAAARRGAIVRVVFEDDFTQTSVAALQALMNQGLDVDVRIQKAKTMHEKFGVLGNDVFFGSANFSESSSTKHSENRITVKNHEETARQFQSRFDELWVKSKLP